MENQGLFKQKLTKLNQKKIFNFFIFLFIFLLPIYIFPSGNPQISSFMIFPLIICSFFKFKWAIKDNWPLTTLFFAFVIYTIVINLYWSMQLNDISLNKHSLYYGFNFFIYIIFYIFFLESSKSDIRQMIQGPIKNIFYFLCFIAPLLPIYELFKLYYPAGLLENNTVIQSKYFNGYRSPSLFILTLTFSTFFYGLYVAGLNYKTIKEQIEKFFLYSFFFIIPFYFNYIDLSFFKLLFNNPNQLAYFSLIIMTFIISTKEKMRPDIAGLLFILSTFIVLSKSRAAILAAGVLLIFYYIKSWWQRILIITLPILAYLIKVKKFNLSTTVTANIDRLKDFNSLHNFSVFMGSGEYDSFLTRGIDRLINHSKYLIWGAGEGAYDRFESFLFNNEIHSNFFSVLFCYGLPGLSLLLIFHFLILKNTSQKYVLYFLLSTQIYGFFHYGLRQPFYWILLAYLTATSQNKRKSLNAN